ncbi:hypothetical protein AYL99_03809 [Fonsecaea erecta]|uniref:Uncharacterized protein n=1 Tax=Fonsecaea erecta TaxID=1367422 RepID=A0A178ZQG3_9EURO|nr:hypothetical protein AYL99_03809 [Fonsecaea erecta]OAP61606.1 hypothetical protein AYL99_03809 [Fonsecaea erecta]
MASALINPPNLPPKPNFSYVQSTPISPTASLITVAGQIGVDPQTNIAPSTFAEQVHVALQNLGICLAAAGATPADIVKVQHYVVNLDPKDTSRGEAWLNFIGDHRPPSTLLGVAALATPALLYEVEAMAIIQRK